MTEQTRTDSARDHDDKELIEGMIGVAKTQDRHDWRTGSQHILVSKADLTLPQGVMHQNLSDFNAHKALACLEFRVRV